MDLPNIHAFASVSGPGPSISSFHNAHNFQMIGPTITNIGRDQINHFGPSVNYYVKRPLCLFVQELKDYFIVGSRQEGSPFETVDIVRKFDQEEDRDTFESQLKKSSWAPFSMQPLWRVNVNGSPCLAVSSIPVYTLQEMFGKVPPDTVKENVYLKIAVRLQLHHAVIGT
ncbi:hypothetical protein GYMLUDRAFT_42459 [Collybiopsis luxurians FD-317 M1]|uniref:Uncharacterized protein n=1 Tax=Collybiopsis luxurians FD-317 M1 TaxID=944289 RepID=A0A0D0BE59_9AGAR|nr:hypothetical protein GYMLUDRAFT_42459 [Collybiopsis luxurians FD-317 M1]